jgi:hypothetical protein
MSYTDKHIVEAYSQLFEGLSDLNKLELIERLSKSLKTENTKKEKAFYKSFGAFSSEKPAEEIISELKSSRNFRNKDIAL